jgi:hypothetical protein
MSSTPLLNVKLYCPLYTSYDAVKVLLANKVQFQTSPTELIDGELPNALLGALIGRAETRVEQDLASRYSIPFVSKKNGTYLSLPDHTKRGIQTAVDLRAVVEVLMTDFGRGTHVQGETYYKGSLSEYNGYIDILLGRNREAANEKRDRFRFTPPMADLLLAPSNREADDGYKGMIINTDGSRRGAETYAVEQINNPAATYINRRLDMPENPI